MPYQQQSAIDDRLAEQTYVSWEARLNRLARRKGRGIIGALSTMFKKEEVTTESFTWYEKNAYPARQTQINGGISNGAVDTTLTVDDSSVFSPGMIIMAIADASGVAVTREPMLVQSVPSSTTIVVVRGATLNGDISNVTLANNYWLGVENMSLAQGTSRTATLIRDSTERTSRIGTLQREISLYEDDQIYAVKTDQKGMMAERRADAEEEVATDYDETFLFARPFTYGTRANRRSQTLGFYQAIAAGAASNIYALTSATVIGDGTSTSVVDALVDLYDRNDGSFVKMGICGAGFYNKFQDLALNWPNTEIQLKQETDSRGINVMNVDFSGYKLKLMRAPFLNRIWTNTTTNTGVYSNFCFIIDPANIVIAHPRGWASPKYRKLPKTSNREDGWEFVWKWGLKVRHPETHGIIDLQSIA